MTIGKFYLMSRTHNPESFRKATYHELSHDLQLCKRIIFSLKSFRPLSLVQALWISKLYTEMLIYRELLKNEIDRRAELIPSGVLLRDLPILDNNIKLASYERQ